MMGSSQAIDFKGPDIRLLVVDRDPDCCMLLAYLFEPFDAHVEVAHSADHAIKVVEQSKVNVMISDVALPGEDGFSLMWRIKQLECQLGYPIPAIALSGYFSQRIRYRAYKAGFCQFFSKPVEDLDALANSVFELVGYTP